MSSGRSSIHLSGSDGSVALTLLHLVVDCFVAVDRVLAQVLHVHTQGLVLAHFEATYGSHAGIYEQILDLFVINFHHADINLKSRGGILKLADPIEDLVTSNGHDSNVRPVSNLNLSNQGDLPSSRICQRRFVRRQTDSSCIPPRRCRELACPVRCKHRPSRNNAVRSSSSARCYRYRTRRDSRKSSRR